MSWEAHAGKLVAGGRVYAAAILRPDGKIYGQTAEMRLGERAAPGDAGDATGAVNEAKGLTEAAAGAGEARGGVWINGVRYRLLNWDAERSVGYYKCLKGGATLARTAKTVIVGLWSEEKTPQQTGGQCNVAVEKLADDFRKINY